MKLAEKESKNTKTKTNCVHIQSLFTQGLWYDLQKVHTHTYLLLLPSEHTPSFQTKTKKQKIYKESKKSEATVKAADMEHSIIII